MYGSNNHADCRENQAKYAMVATIETQSIKSTKNAPNGDCNPKKTIDHKIFSASCIPKIILASVAVPASRYFRFSPKNLPVPCQFFDQTKYNEIPIRKNKITQTRPIKNPDGVKAGLFKNAYQLLIFGVVNNEPTTPANSQIATLAINFNILLLFGIVAQPENFQIVRNLFGRRKIF